MGRIRVLLLAGPDLEAGAVPYLEALVSHVEWEWFQMGVAGVPHLVPSHPAMVQREALDPGAGWFGGSRDLLRLQELAAGYDLVDCHGYRALTWATRSRLDRARLLYTRHHLPPSAAERRRETWLMGRAARVIAPDPEHARGAGPRVRLAPLTRARHRSDPRADRPAARRRLGLADRPVIAVAADAGADRRVLDALRDGLPEAVMVPLRGSLGAEAPTPDSALALAAADLVLFPRTTDGDDAGLLDGALALGRAVVASRVPGVVGRFRCLTEGYLLPVGHVESWVELVRALLDDADLRDGVADNARRAYGAGGPGQEVRVLESEYAGVLLEATGQCPVCSPAAGTAI